MESELIKIMQRNDPEMIEGFIGKIRLEGDKLCRDKFVHMVQCATLNGHHIPHFETTLNLLTIHRENKSRLKF